MAGAEVMEEGEKAAKAEFKKKVEEMEWGVPLLPGKLKERQTLTAAEQEGPHHLGGGIY